MPKNTQKIIGWIVSVLLLAAFLFYAHRVYGGSSSVSDVLLMIVTCVAGIQVVALCCMEDYGAALLGVWACACRPAVGAGCVVLVGPVGGGPVGRGDWHQSL